VPEPELSEPSDLTVQSVRMCIGLSLSRGNPSSVDDPGISGGGIEVFVDSSAAPLQVPLHFLVSSRGSNAPPIRIMMS